MVLTLPVPDGEGLPGDLGSQTESEAEGSSGHQLSFIPICALCLGQKRQFTGVEGGRAETWLCVPALPRQAV